MYFILIYEPVQSKFCRETLLTDSQEDAGSCEREERNLVPRASNPLRDCFQNARFVCPPVPTAPIPPADPADPVRHPEGFWVTMRKSLSQNRFGVFLLNS
jgi:hypothetical protein